MCVCVCVCVCVCDKRLTAHDPHSTMNKQNINSSSSEKPQQNSTKQHHPLSLLLTMLEYETQIQLASPDPNVYDVEGYNCFGYDMEGYDRNGYNWQGFDRQRRSRWLRRPSTARRIMRRAILSQCEDDEGGMERQMDGLLTSTPTPLPTQQ